MTTKAQERKALEQIRKIVEELGEGSYIGMAFDGCFELAEENIKNDWGCSMKDKVETAEKACDQRREQVQKLLEENTNLKKEVERTNQIVQQKSDRIDDLNRQLAEAVTLYTDANHQNIEMINEIADKDVEIMKLKAKLYDLIVK